jgi:hypothetical protein
VARPIFRAISLFAVPSSPNGDATGVTLERHSLCEWSLLVSFTVLRESIAKALLPKFRWRQNGDKNRSDHGNMMIGVSISKFGRSRLTKSADFGRACCRCLTIHDTQNDLDMTLKTIWLRSCGMVNRALCSQSITPTPWNLAVNFSLIAGGSIRLMLNDRAALRS